MDSTSVSASQDERQWGMFLHFSLLAGFIIPFAGLIAPIVIWQMKKAQWPSIDQHGKNVVNWIISGALYGVLFLILSFLVIGIPLLFALGICSVAFAIIGGIKANNGEIWRYPGALTLLK